MNYLLDNIDQVKNYLLLENKITVDDDVLIRILTGGVSNKTFWIEIHNQNKTQYWVLKQALSKLNVEVDWFSNPERIHREALGMKWLKKLAPANSIVDLIHEDHQNHIIIMSAVPQPHENWKNMLLEGDINDHHVKQFAEILASIHYGSVLIKDDIQATFEDTSYFEQLRLEPYYAYASENVNESRNFLDNLIHTTRQENISLVHGDYSPKNVLVYQDQLILLDHEVIHWGDSAFDIGFSLTHFLSKAHHLLEHKVAFSKAAQLYWADYKKKITNTLDVDHLEQRAVQHTLACLLARVAGRSQLEYFRDDEKIRQKEIVLELINNRPLTIPECIDSFIERIK